MKDGVLKAISSDGTLRAVIATTTHLSEDARLRHNLSFTAAAALGRALTAGVLLSQILAKDGQGPSVRALFEEAGWCDLRLLNDLSGRPRVLTGTAIGSTGYLHVTIDSGFGQPHTSTIELSSGEVGEDINHFLVNTDQTGSLVVVGTHLSKNGVEAAGGLIIQLLSDHTEETICRIENNISTFGTFTFLMKRGMTLEEILQRILTGFEITPLTDVKPVSFACKCSRERFVEALKVLPSSEIISMAEEDGQAEGRCQFCNELYLVEKEGLLDLAKES